ncbi:MAG: S8 family serine peptidase [Candidatus Saccharibacteria bacterium]|nr:MAG: S8 family serine peptidase [Candidatus Saccharibacteria bacterium]
MTLHSAISHIKNKVLLTSVVGLLLILAISLGWALYANAFQKTSSTANLKQVASSVIRTSNLAKSRLAVQQSGLQETRVTPLPGKGGLITVTGSTSALNSVERTMQADSGFKIFPNYNYKPAITPNDPLFANNSQWNLTKINAPQAWDTATGSQETTIAIIDSGVLFSQGWAASPDCPTQTPCQQSDLPTQRAWVNSGEVGSSSTEGPAPNCTTQSIPIDKSCNNIDDDSNGFIDDTKGWDFMGGWRGDSAACPNFASPTTYQSSTYPEYITYDNDPQPYSCDSPAHQNELNRNHFNGSCQAFESACYTSHGTSVAGIAAASSNNSNLIAGIDWNTKIMSLRALDGYGWGNSALITAAVEYATQMGADVINLSLAVYDTNGDCTVTDQLLEDALASAKAAGIIIVGAAGNGGTEGVCYPGRSVHALATGATTSSDTRASFSSYGAGLDVMAPGAGVATILAPDKSNNYSSSSLGANGTSFSAPHISGIASVLIGKNPTLTPAEIRDTIAQSADRVAGMEGASYTKEYGFGRVNMKAVVDTTLPTYSPLQDPRQMWLSEATQKTNLLTGEKSGEVLSRERIVRFTTKTLVNGVWYLRSEHDTNNSFHFGIPFSALREMPSYTPLVQPRDMKLAYDTQKTSLLTAQKSGETFLKGRVIRFTTKTYLNGVWYLRSEHDTNYNYHLGFPLSSLREK